MIALLHKETAALWPFWVAGALLVAGSMASLLWDPDFVLLGLGGRFSSGLENAAILWFVGLFIGHGAVAHEVREGHVEFLDALPISRWQVFLAKVCAGSLLVSILVLNSLLSDLVLVWLSRPPLATSPMQPLVLMHTVMLICGVGGLGMGMVLSWLGPLGFGALGLTALILVCMGTPYPAIRGWMPMMGLGDLAWDGSRTSHPIAPLVATLLLGAAGMLLSGLLFTGPGRVLTNRGSQVVSVVRGGVIGVLALLVLPLGALVLAMIGLRDGGTLWRGIEVLETPQFRVLRVPGDPRGAEIAAGIDALSARVGAIVGNPDPLGLDIELLGAPRNHEGLFTGGKIRLSRTATDDTLAHELAHAHAFALSGVAAWSQHEHTHFFSEGLAEWVAGEAMGTQEIPPFVGAVWATDQVQFQDLVERSAHLAKHDVQQAYALGHAFVVALVAQEGPDAPACVLRGLGEVGDQPVAGLALWYGLARTCDLDLDAVIDRWIDLMRAERAALPAILPSLRVSVPTTGPIRLVVRDEAELGWILRCGFRDGPDTPPNRWAYVNVRSGACEVPPFTLSGHSFQYQVGYRLPPPRRSSWQDVYLPWTDAARH